MYPMMFAAGILYAVLVAVIAFFVLFAAQKAEGFVALLGRILGIVLLVLALLILTASITAPMFGGRPFGMHAEQSMHGRYMRDGYMHDGYMHGPSAAPAAAPEESSEPAPETETPAN